jgi:hypothetical protein
MVGGWVGGWVRWQETSDLPSLLLEVNEEAFFVVAIPHHLHGLVLVHDHDALARKVTDLYLSIKVHRLLNLGGV